MLVKYLEFLINGGKTFVDEGTGSEKTLWYSDGSWFIGEGIEYGYFGEVETTEKRKVPVQLVREILEKEIKAKAQKEIEEDMEFIEEYIQHVKGKKRTL